ncbi:MAG TPA: hypothetical protein VI895_07980 [Bdellovibrionota bacterium]|nr:hypothetical protein [Bdellovibrionota bacterium]
MHNGMTLENGNELDLYLDHFFVGIDRSKFDELAVLAELIPGTRVEAISSGDSSWKGVYPRSSSGIYIELLERSGDWKDAGLGLCLSKLGKEAYVEEKLKRIFPGIEWASETWKWNGETPWFKLFMQKGQDREIRARTLAMEYQGTHREHRFERIGDPSTPIERFVSMEMTIPETLLTDLNQKWHRWLPGSRSLTNGVYTMEIPCYQSTSFKLMATPGPGAYLPRVRKITARLKPDCSVREYAGPSFQLSCCGPDLAFEFEER